VQKSCCENTLSRIFYELLKFMNDPLNSSTGKGNRWPDPAV
jgi:hypothetical protein